MSKYNWTRQETKDLITLYEINECLWNKSLREYKDRDERVSSIQSISDEMKISIEEINKKIHNLRNQYRFELNKMKKNIPGKPKYITKWPYFKNLSFLENIVSVRGSNNSHGNGDYNETNEYTMEEAENSNDQKNVISPNETATIVATAVPKSSQPQQASVFHVSVEYEEEAKPKKNVEILQNGRKRRLMTKDGIEIVQHPQLLNQFSQPSSSTLITKQTPTIIIDDKSQDQVLKDVEEMTTKKARVGDEKVSNDKKLDKFEIFGLFVGNEMRSLSNPLLQKKLKRKILECILEISDEQDAEEETTQN